MIFGFLALLICFLVSLNESLVVSLLGHETASLIVRFSAFPADTLFCLCIGEELKHFYTLRCQVFWQLEFGDDVAFKLHVTDHSFIRFQALLEEVASVAKVAH